MGNTDEREVMDAATKKSTKRASAERPPSQGRKREATYPCVYVHGK